jgi:hypothetical protein
MIEEKYVESARNIRKQYAIISSELDNQKISVTKLREYLLERHSELEDMRLNGLPKIKKKEELVIFLNKIVDKVKEIESLESLSSTRVDELTKKMDNLKIEEKELTDLLIKKYPKMSLEEIKREIHSRL